MMSKVDIWRIENVLRSWLNKRYEHKRYRILVIITLVILTTMSGCKNRNSIWKADLTAPFSIVYHSVPFAIGDSVWDEAELLEKDAYGRELYFYRVSSYFSSDFTGDYYYSYVLVVCQKCENNQVYYYEDQCYLLVKSESYSAAEVEKIKTANDWNKPYNTEKMISVANTFDHSSFADEEKCIESFKETVNADWRYELAYDEITVINGESLCVLRKYHTDDNTNIYDKNYVALFSEDGELISYISFDGTFEEFPSRIIQFKQERHSNTVLR